MSDPWARVVQLRQELFNAPSVHARSAIAPSSSKSSAERDELRMWRAIDRCEVALNKLVAEMEKLASVRAEESKSK